MKINKRMITRYLFLTIFMIVLIYPVIWMFFSSLKQPQEIFGTTSLLPSEWMWNNYADGWNAFSRYSFGVFFFNSFKVVAFTVIGTIISTTMAGYAFARLNFPFKNILFSILMGTIMLPQQILIIQRYSLFSRLGWVNSYLPLIIPAFAAQFSGAFFIFLMIQFVRGLPKELDEAAIIDGCGHFGIFYYIILPNLKPAIFSVALFASIWSWNDFMNQLLYINDVGKFTISLGLRMFLDNVAAVNWGAFFAMSLLSILPIMILFFIGQRFFIEGIATTGIKG
ncbi:MAG TPA: carbohydrate ABC transporter permease [Halanaerobiales bacterium]|nr:carbohydrate ABC transporter permease [Halanaerobiales bacterium]